MGAVFLALRMAEDASQAKVARLLFSSDKEGTTSTTYTTTIISGDEYCAFIDMQSG